MNKLVLLFLIGIVLLTSCKSVEQITPQSKDYFVSDEGIEEKKVFIVGEEESYNAWYIQTQERRWMLREFRNEFWQNKEDFEFEKRNQFKNVKAVIDGELIFGYSEGADMDKTYEQSLVQPDIKSDSIFATASGAGGGFR